MVIFHSETAGIARDAKRGEASEATASLRSFSKFLCEAASMRIFFRQGRLTKVRFQKGCTDKKQNIPDLPKTGGRVYC